MIRRPPRSTPFPNTTLFRSDRTWALYDGRATAEENWEERTGLAAAGGDGRFTAAAEGPLLQSPHPPHGLRYADVDRKSTRLNSSHANISYAVFCLKKKKEST